MNGAPTHATSWSTSQPKTTGHPESTTSGKVSIVVVRRTPTYGWEARTSKLGSGVISVRRSGRRDLIARARVAPVCEHVFVSGAATILHADLDSFFASVEQRDDPRLRGKPVIVGGGVVLAASYEAKAFGIHSAMGGRQARLLCPRAIVVPPRMDAYSEASKAVFEVFADTTPLVEGLSIDEAFLDVGGLGRVSGTPTEIAIRLRREVLERVGLPITVGVARTKFLAKVASAVAKPDGLLFVAPDRELEFLHALPIERLWGVGPKTSNKLRERGINTVGEVACLSEAILVGLVGKGSGRHLHALAQNYDPRPVQVGRRRRSMGSQHALGRRPRAARRAGRDRGRARRPRRAPAACRRPGGAHGRAAPAVRRLLARSPGHTRSNARRRTPTRSSPRSWRCSTRRDR